MAIDDITVVAVRPLDGPETRRLYYLEIARNDGLPRMLSRVTFEGQDFIVAGMVDFGDGKGPIALGLLQDDEEPEAAPS